MVSLEAEQPGTLQEEDLPAGVLAVPPSARNVDRPGSSPGSIGVDTLESYREKGVLLHQEADQLYAQGQFLDAELKVRQLLGLQHQVVGPHHPDFALGLCMLGELRFLQDDRGSAEVLFRQALEIRRQTLGERHPDYAANLGCLGGVLWHRGRLEEAEAMLRQALAIRFEVLGERHPDSIHTRKELARLLRRKGDWAGAQALVRLSPAPTEADGARPDRPSGRDLGQDVVVISAVFSRLGERLAATAAAMRSRGTPPGAGLVEELAEGRRGFLALRQETLRRVEALGLPFPAEDSFSTLQDVAAWLDGVAEAEVAREERERLRSLALQVLAKVLSLASVSESAAPFLRQCQVRAWELAGGIAGAHWTALPSQAESLVEGEHIFAHLVALVDGHEHLSDRQWASLHESVGSAFGKVLASAASRGQLALGPEPLDPRVAPLADEPVPGYEPQISDIFSLAPAIASLDAETPGRGGTVASAGESGPTIATPDSRFPDEPDLDAWAGEPPAALPQAHRQDPRVALVCDLAVASLVPTMGRVINLPSDSSSESRQHRLFRVGYAPTVVPYGARDSLPKRHEGNSRAEEPADSRVGRVPQRFAALLRFGPWVNYGPLRLAKAAWPSMEPASRERREGPAPSLPAVSNATRPSSLPNPAPSLAAFH